MDPADELRRLTNGYQVSQAIHVAATLGISDLLRSGPVTIHDLALATGTHGRSLTRLMRALSSVGLYIRDDNDAYENTELGSALRVDAPGSVAGWAKFVGRRYYWQAWAGLDESVRTGENAFTAAHAMSVWEYRNLHPEELQIFDGAMTSLSQATATAVVDAYDFGRFGRVVDVGGGWGGMLAAILSRHPALTGVLFDQPRVVAGAAGLLERAGVADRCETVGGSFFDSVPPGGDAYLLRDVVHDWPDAEAVEILRTCRRAVPPHGSLLLVERLLDDGPNAARVAFSDLNMLVAPGGQERTVDEYRALRSTAGFRLMRALPTDSIVAVVEASPV